VGSEMCIRDRLIQLAEKYKALEINGVQDTVGYKMVDTARKDLKAKRRDVEKFVEAYLKQKRELYNADRKEALDVQDDHVKIIASIERELKEKQEKIDQEILKAERMALLPERKQKLEEIDFMVADDELLLMNPSEFQEFYNEKKSEYLEEKERKIKKQEAVIAREKELEAARQKARESAEKKAKEEAERKEEETKEREEKIKKEAEEEKQKAIEEERRRAEEEKQRIIDEQKDREAKRIEAEERGIREVREREDSERVEREKLEKRKKYQEFLLSNGYTEENKSDFRTEVQESETILFKKVAIFKHK
jgi:hypothetical protein